MNSHSQSSQSHPSIRQTAAANDGLLAFIADRTGLVFAESRMDSALSGIDRAMQRADMASLVEYRRLVENDSAAFDDLVGELTVGETYFFRDPEQFDVIRERILPAIRQNRQEQQQIRVWSAGCASGEEAYSLAILFRDAGIESQTRILATDISRSGLLKAREGRYRDWSLRGRMQDLAKRYLRRDAGLHVLDERIRQLVAFDYLNLALDNYPSFATETFALDLIVCRNVLIYFDKPTIAGVIQRFYDCLNAGGWLVLGAADGPVSAFAQFESIMTDAGILYRKPVATPERSDERPLAVDSGIGTTPLAVDSAEPTSPSASIFDEDDDATVEMSRSGDSTMLHAEDVVIQEAQAALAGGAYGQVVELVGSRTDSPVASALCVRALANFDTARALELCAELTLQHPTTVELHYLHSVLLLEQGRNREAADAVRRTLFLDRALAIAHFTLGTIMQRLDDLPAARRAFRNAQRLCRSLSADHVLALSDGERASRLADAIEKHLQLIAAQEAE